MTPRSAGSADIAYVVSVMGLEESGLPIAAQRYSAALEDAHMRAMLVVVSETDHPEHGGADHVADLDSLLSLLTRSDPHRTVCLWVGLHRTRKKYEGQLRVMRHLWARGAINVVVPERTEMPQRTAYRAFEALMQDGCVAGLVHFNDLEAESWARRVSIPSVVAPPPLPMRLFEHRDPRFGGNPAERQPTIVFVGRLTRRKGADWLAVAWPEWRRRLVTSGLDVSLRVYGRSFQEDRSIAERFQELQAQPELSVRWQLGFLAPDDMPALSGRAVGIALSRQEFDGIATSELLALGLPVVATPTAGHRALSLESDGVLLRRTREACVAEAARLLADDEVREALGRRARADMVMLRSAEIVGRRLFGFLSSLTALRV